MQATFCELESAGLIAFTGEDATSFLHAQLTSDVAGLAMPRTQYSGYCSPKGRLLAACLLWRRETDLLLQLPGHLRESLQARLAKYVLRARVSVVDASTRYALFGIAGNGASGAISHLGLVPPGAPHDVVSIDGVDITRLPGERYLMAVPVGEARQVSASLRDHARQHDESLWSCLDIEAGIPVIVQGTQDQYVPQMVNLDLIGGVSYTKGCYPGQEIVARTHHLGRLKQRMYRIRLPMLDPVPPGEPLFSPQFGNEQASGAILYAARSEAGAHEALAVVQIASAGGGDVRVTSPEGPKVEFLPLPYALPS